LSKIAPLSQKHDNWEFRSWLKQNAPNNIDGIVKELSQKYFAPIDCTQCENCCRSLQTEFKKSELHTIAETLGRSIKAFEKQPMSEGIVNPPCPILDGKLTGHVGTKTYWFGNAFARFAVAENPREMALGFF